MCSAPGDPISHQSASPPREAPEASLAKTQSDQVAAFFDLDKTIIATSSAHAFSKEFLSKGVITPLEAFQISLATAIFMRAGQSSEAMDSTRDYLSGMIAGWSVADIQTMAHETIHSVMIPAIYSEARELINFHKEAGHDVIIVSASAIDLVEPIARELNADAVIATELEVIDGMYTGAVLSYNKGAAKAAAIQQMATEKGYDLTACFAYSDSATDIPMLEVVGNPVAVNPDRAMKKAALANGWTIRSFKNPEPLFTAPTAREVTIGTGVVAGIAAVTAGVVWFAGRSKRA
ncbi:HAD family hydrolase [Corynebacterium caspium]|uniref:HAD family hydrolase n=1 Tax=Corynebacterium caspium TaxID=234828 RepID=UPI00037115DC|nr:HAD-IB family hydrolase [Corynebacterium caspium]WKD58571.1 Phosphoserine phosphatase [Corynebacterium caspium DSM 44850]